MSTKEGVMLSEPLTASQISATMKSFEHKMTGLKRRIQKLGDNDMIGTHCADFVR